jgi:hypothetical protein
MQGSLQTPRNTSLPYISLGARPSHRRISPHLARCESDERVAAAMDIPFGRRNWLSMALASLALLDAGRPTKSAAATVPKGDGCGVTGYRRCAALPCLLSSLSQTCTALHLSHATHTPRNARISHPPPPLPPHPTPPRTSAEYEELAASLVKTLRESVSADLTGADEREVRRKADPAKPLVKRFMTQWQGAAVVREEESYRELRGEFCFRLKMEDWRDDAFNLGLDGKFDCPPPPFLFPCSGNRAAGQVLPAKRGEGTHEP